MSSLALAAVHGDMHAVERLLRLKTTDVNETIKVCIFYGVARRIRRNDEEQHLIDARNPHLEGRDKAPEPTYHIRHIA